MRLYRSLSFVLLVLLGTGCTKDNDLDLSVYFTGTIDGVAVSYTETLRNNDVKLNTSQSGDKTFYQQRNQIGSFSTLTREGIEINLHFDRKPTAAVISGLQGQTISLVDNAFPFVQLTLYTPGVEGESTLGIPQEPDSFLTIDDVRPLTGYNPGAASSEAFGDAFLLTGRTRFRTASTSEVFAEFALMMISYR